MSGVLVSFWRDRELMFELSRRELFQPHANHLFGSFWAFANPLLTMGLYFLVFRFVFPTRLPDGGAPEVFLIAGLLQWVTMSEVLAKSCAVLRNNASLIKQISFPVEILVGKTVLASIQVQIIMTGGLFVVMGAAGQLSFAAVGLWFCALVVQSLFMLGVALALSAVTPFVPDVAEFVGIIARMGLFVTPILYAASQFGPAVEPLFFANPFAYFAWTHQQALHSQSITDVAPWVGAALWAIGALALGRSLFKLLSPAFTDVL